MMIESLGQLLLSVTIYGSGLALAIAGLILGISRSTTKNNNHWGTLFSAFAFAIALVIPNVYYSVLVMGFGAVGLTLGFGGLIKEVGRADIFILAVIAVSMNVLMSLGFGAYDLSWEWQQNYESSYDDIEDLLTGQFKLMEESLPESGIHAPNTLDEENNTIINDFLDSEYIEDAFRPITTGLTIGTYLAKASAFISMVAFAPMVLAAMLNTEAIFANSIIVLLMGLIITLWQMAIFYKLVKFVLGKYGTS